MKEKHSKHRSERSRSPYSNSTRRDYYREESPKYDKKQYSQDRNSRRYYDNQYDRNNYRGANRKNNARNKNPPKEKRKYENLNNILPNAYQVILRDENDEIDPIFEKNLIYKTENTGESDIPEFLKIIGDPSELNKEKDRIDDVPEIWDSIKYLLNEYELVDIYRPESIQKKRYSIPVVNYSSDYYPREQEQAPIFSRAYFKLWETINEFKVLDNLVGQKLTIACLAEGPGGFIQCLLDYRQLKEDETSMEKIKPKWKEDEYYGITLKLTYDDGRKGNDWEFQHSKNYFNHLRRQGYTINLGYGADDGDLYQRRNIDHFSNKDLNGKKCQLVTSDGGIEVRGRNYNFQELANVKLFLGETLTALQIQEKGGAFILKIYDSIYDTTCEVIQLLCLFYTKVRIIKPLLSRPASSERYVLCENFQGITTEQLEHIHQVLEEWKDTETNINDYLGNPKKAKHLFNLKTTENNISWINNKFNPNLASSNSDCITKQIKKIQKGFELIDQKKNEEKKYDEYKTQRLKEQQTWAAAWCKRHDIPYY